MPSAVVEGRDTSAPVEIRMTQPRQHQSLLNTPRDVLIEKGDCVTQDEDNGDDEENSHDVLELNSKSEIIALKLFLRV